MVRRRQEVARKTSYRLGDERKVLSCIILMTVSNCKFEQKYCHFTDFYIVEEMGKTTPLPLNPPTPEDIVTINFTSGTSGM